MSGPRISRSRSGMKHAVDDEVPVSQEINRESAPAVTVQPLTMELVGEQARIHNEGFGSKLLCLCCPATKTEGEARKFFEKHPERLPMCGMAVDGSGAALGFIQLAVFPLQDKDGLHRVKPGETYIEQIGVGAAARGKGVGKLLLQWAEARAREHNCTLLSLAVLNGNPAHRLYERFGFQDEPADACDMIIGGPLVCCLLGRPYGVCDPHCGAVDMHKPLI